MRGSDRHNRNVRVLAARAGLLAAVFVTGMWSMSGPICAQDDMVKFVEEKSLELKIREDALKKEEERLNILRKDVDEKIEKYSALLNRVDSALKKAEQLQDERLLNMAKVYEAMPPEAAASQLSAMDIETAAQIMLRMKSKKAGPIIALLKSTKAVTLTKKMASLQIKQ